MAYRFLQKSVLSSTIYSTVVPVRSAGHQPNAVLLTRLSSGRYKLVNMLRSVSVLISLFVPDRMEEVDWIMARRWPCFRSGLFKNSAGLCRNGQSCARYLDRVRRHACMSFTWQFVYYDMLITFFSPLSESLWGRCVIFAFVRASAMPCIGSRHTEQLVWRKHGLYNTQGARPTS